MRAIGRQLECSIMDVDEEHDGEEEEEEVFIMLGIKV